MNIIDEWLNIHGNKSIEKKVKEKLKQQSMSTTFGIRTSSIHDSEEVEEIEIAFRGNGTGFYWITSLAKLLPDNQEVIALDNDCDDIKTIGDIKEAIKNQRG